MTTTVITIEKIIERARLDLAIAQAAARKARRRRIDARHAIRWAQSLEAMQAVHEATHTAHAATARIRRERFTIAANDEALMRAGTPDKLARAAADAIMIVTATDGNASHSVVDLDYIYYTACEAVARCEVQLNIARAYCVARWRRISPV
jgi:hypothetical protein